MKRILSVILSLVLLVSVLVIPMTTSAYFTSTKNNYDCTVEQVDKETYAYNSGEGNLILGKFPQGYYKTADIERTAYSHNNFAYLTDGDLTSKMIGVPTGVFADSNNNLPNGYKGETQKYNFDEAVITNYEDLVFDLGGKCEITAFINFDTQVWHAPGLYQVYVAETEADLFTSESHVLNYQRGSENELSPKFVFNGEKKPVGRYFGIRYLAAVTPSWGGGDAYALRIAEFAVYGNSLEVDTTVVSVDSGEKRNLLDHSTANNHPTWSKNKDTINGETVVYQEPVLFYTDNGNVRSNVKLMYPVENIVAVTSYTTIGGAFKWYREGTDFTVNIDGTISLTDDSSIPHSINLSEIKYGIGTSGIWNSASTWQSQLPKNQVLVTYTYTKTWDGVDYSVPTYSNSISTAYDKLSNGDTLDVLFIGDSISTGCNASGQDGTFYSYRSDSVGNTFTIQGWSRYLGLSVKPYWVNDSWDKQVVANIQAAYPNATINVKNRSVGSSASQWYFNHIDELLVTGSLGDVGLENTDLIFIGFGMNEGNNTAATQNANTKKIIDYLRDKNPDVSIVLVSAFYPTFWDSNNQKWTNYRLGEQEDGYFELAEQYENIAVAPVNTAFVNILKAKEGVDYIANGINHPNDYGVNLYADTITATILSCNHKHTTVHQATPSTCQVQGNEEYTTCDKCGEVISGSDAKLPLADHNISNTWSSDATGHWHACQTEGCTHKSDEASHSGGEATCKDKAVCSVCSTAYGEVDVSNHKNTEVRDAKAATCNMPGYTGDTWCLDCNTKIEDGTTIPATGKHVDADGKWESNATQHFHTCGCGTEFDKENHKGGEATCKDKAVCSVCNTAYGEVDASNHKNTEVRDAKKPTEQEKGYTGDTWCTDCNTKIADGKEIDKLEHKPALVKAVAATAAKEGNIEYYYCENCGKYYSDEEGTKEIKKEDTIIAKLAPTVIDGNNAKIDKSSKDPVSFRSDASFADFVRVELDGKELVKDKDYTVKEGSIIVTLTPEFLATLPAGDHTLSIVSVSGTAKADFSVTADKVEDTSSKAESSETTPAKENSEKSPQTGCDLNTVLLSLAGIISLAVLSVFAVFKKRLRKSR